VFKIEDLADYLYLNIRSIQRKFKADLGVTPKELARNFRFDAIKKKLASNPNTTLVDLAYEFGYTDLSHFIKDFKKFAGETPLEFCQRVLFNRR
jgi:AraC-like DNA-binding protein